MNVQKLFVGLSITESLPTPELTEKLFTAKSFPFGLLSIPNAAVLELSLKSKRNPFVPYDPVYLLGNQTFVCPPVNPKDDGPRDSPSTKLTSAIYPSQY